MGVINQAKVEAVVDSLEVWETSPPNGTSITPLEILLGTEKFAGNLRKRITEGSAIDYKVAAIALILASEYVESINNLATQNSGSTSALTWRLRWAVEAITLIKSKTPEEIEEFLKSKYPSGV
ncbi:MAG: hypothetical protein RMY36_032490 [Nostoc sp. SerVER01]|nr:hypothetical protein [Nostoc sp. SerVER01]